MSNRLPTRGPGRDTWVNALVWSAGFVGVLWVLEVLDQVLFRGGLDGYGIRPLDTGAGLAGIVFAPLLHGGIGHLVANTVPLLVLGFLILLSGVARWLAVTAIVWIVGGLGTWLTGGFNTLHLGASVLVFGWLVYLLLRGVFSRRVGQIAVGVLVLLLYGGALWGVFPGQPGISWQAHLFGAIGGGLAAYLLARDDARPVPTQVQPRW